MRLNPFKWFVIQNFPFIEEDFDAITNYQLLCKVVEYLNKTIDKTNELGAEVEALNNWFNSLDVQDEINNKLDEMAESGELAVIIGQYLQYKTAIINDTVADMKQNENLVNNTYAKTLGYYSIGDGGESTYRILSGNYTNNNKDIIQLNNGLFAVMVKPKELNIKQFGAISDGTLDNTEILQSAINYTDSIYIPKGIYNLSATININLNTKINGESMTDSILQNTLSSDFPLFQYLSVVSQSPYDNKTNIEFSNLKIKTKYFIKINENTLTDVQWGNQASLLAIHFKQLWINGLYNNDTKANTNIIPTFDELEEYGIAFNLNSIFDSEIKNCNINGYGIAIYLKGCDINNINYNRMTNNGIHIMTQRISTYGSQNRIVHNDLLYNQRYGGITLNSTRFDTIEDNYFESYSASCCGVKGNNEFECSIINNRFDSPTVNNVNIIDVSPSNCDIIVGNRVNPNTNTVYINVDYNNLDLINFNNTNSAIVKNNNSKIGIRNNPYILTDNYIPNRIAPNNINSRYGVLAGSLYTSPYSRYDSDEDLYYFNNVGSSGDSLILIFRDLKKYYLKYPKIKLSCKSTGETQFYVLIKGDNNTIYQDFIQLSNNNKINFIELDLTSSATIYNEIYIELPLASYKLYSVELI